MIRRNHCVCRGTGDCGRERHRKIAAGQREREKKKMKMMINKEESVFK